MIVRSTVSPYYHYTDTDNREKATAKLTKQNKKKKKKGDEVHCGRKKYKKIQSCDKKMTNVSGQQG